MKKIIFLFSCLFFIVFNPVLGSKYISPTLELQKCKEVADREERNHCLAKWQNKKEEEEKKELFIDEKTGAITKEKCQRFHQSRLRAECIVEYQKQERKKQQKETLQEDFTPPEKPELFLKIVPCEKKATRMEKIECYNDFHTELLQKQKEEKQKSESSKGPVLTSSTLQILECKKISDRTERSACYTQLRLAEQEEQEERFRQEQEDFDPIAEEKKCREISDNQNRAKCFHRFEQLQNRIINEQESTFQPSDVRKGR